MGTTIIISLLTTVLNTLTTVLAIANELPGIANIAQELNTAITAITGAIQILTLPN